jgi:hypothetical protein
LEQDLMGAPDALNGIQPGVQFCPDEAKHLRIQLHYFVQEMKAGLIRQLQVGNNGQEWSLTERVQRFGRGVNTGELARGTGLSRCRGAQFCLKGFISPDDQNVPCQAYIHFGKANAIVSTV